MDDEVIIYKVWLYPKGSEKPVAEKLFDNENEAITWGEEYESKRNGNRYTIRAVAGRFKWGE